MNLMEFKVLQTLLTVFGNLFSCISDPGGCILYYLFQILNDCFQLKIRLCLSLISTLYCFSKIKLTCRVPNTLHCSQLCSCFTVFVCFSLATFVWYYFSPSLTGFLFPLSCSLLTVSPVVKSIAHNHTNGFKSIAHINIDVKLRKREYSSQLCSHEWNPACGDLAVILFTVLMQDHGPGGISFFSQKNTVGLCSTFYLDWVAFAVIPLVRVNDTKDGMNSAW